ncbi:MAG: Ni/Fe hydrogenase subunit gamma [Nitrospinae bacterium CG11_big_fil_rev_8_21_14_0_20_56_8]|nr:MAG: Ni/Fe hydrogenase subunit gamma [Nitrospinae bacterium CG11_big_fil_rev_8_21_14_0_20_56_8]
MNPVNPMLPEVFKIRRSAQNTEDVFTLELERKNGGGAGFPFKPGQFNMLYVFGVGEVPISISGDPTRPHSLVHTTRAVGTVTRTLCQLKPGDEMGVRGPFGTSWPVEEAEGNDIVIVTGGIGLAPLRPALYQMFARRERYGKIYLLYGARSPGDLLYMDEVGLWQHQYRIETRVTVDAARRDWKGNVGVVTHLVGKISIDPVHTMAFICGPEIMMRFTRVELTRIGVSPDRTFISMERNMKCAVGFCGHCQYGPHFICKDGPVFRFDRIQNIFGRREI